MRLRLDGVQILWLRMTTKTTRTTLADWLALIATFRFAPRFPTGCCCCNNRIRTMMTVQTQPGGNHFQLFIYICNLVFLWWFWHLVRGESAACASSMAWRGESTERNTYLSCSLIRVVLRRGASETSSKARTRQNRAPAETSVVCQVSGVRS